MSYTVLRVTEDGVVLFDAHVRRFQPAGEAAVRAFGRFAADAAPGIYSLTWAGDALEARVRTTTSLFEGIPVRYVASPYAGSQTRVVKSPPPNPYQALRQPGTATLLTSEDGTELYESCTAAVVGWSGERFLTPPVDRPCLESTALLALAAAGALDRAPILRSSSAPLGLMNAVSGLIIPAIPGRAPFPNEGRTLAERIFRESARRLPRAESRYTGAA